MDDLTDIFREAFEDNSIILSPKLEIKKIDKWDSLGHVAMIVEIEKKFGIIFSPVEIEEILTISDLTNLLNVKKTKLSK